MLLPPFKILAGFTSTSTCSSTEQPQDIFWFPFHCYMSVVMTVSSMLRVCIILVKRLWIISYNKTHCWSHRPRWKSRQMSWWQHCLNRCQVSLGLRFSTASSSTVTHSPTMWYFDNNEVTVAFHKLQCKEWFYASHCAVESLNIKCQALYARTHAGFLSSMICIAALNPSRVCCLSVPHLHCVCVRAFVCVCVCLDELISAWRLACQSRVVLSIDPLRHLQQLADTVTGLILGNSRPHRMAGLPNEREEIDGISVFFWANDREDMRYTEKDNLRLRPTGKWVFDETQNELRYG